MKDEESVLTKKQIALSRVIMGGALLLLGLFLLLTALKVFKADFGKAALTATLFALGAMLAGLGFVQKNTLCLWLSAPFIIASVVSALAGFSPLGYVQLYPFYILSPALGSLFAGCYSGGWRDHLKVIALFAPSAALFMLNSFWGVSWKIVVPVFVILLGALVVFLAFHKKKE